MQTFYLKHKNIIRTHTNFKLIKISNHSAVVLLQAIGDGVEGSSLPWVKIFLQFFNYFFDFYYMVIEGPLAPNFFYEYLILASTIFPRENYKKLGLTPRECPLLDFWPQSFA